jgi:hypothetical protein
LASRLVYIWSSLVVILGRVDPGHHVLFHEWASYLQSLQVCAANAPTITQINVLDIDAFD